VIFLEDPKGKEKKRNNVGQTTKKQCRTRKKGNAQRVRKQESKKVVPASSPKKRRGQEGGKIGGHGLVGE